MRKTVLLVDDDPEVLELLSFNFKKAGFAVLHAADGLQAITKAGSLSPHLIVLDLMMPELDGFAVLELLRKDPATASIPVIMLTAISGQMARLNALEAGASQFVTKPFSPHQLVSTAEELLGLAPFSPS